MVGDEGLEVPALRADGGAAANDWLMQFQADLLGVPVERPDMVETTALGAAGLAGLALGVWKSTAEFLSGRRFTRFDPGMAAAERQQRRDEWRRAVARRTGVGPGIAIPGSRPRGRRCTSRDSCGAASPGRTRDRED